VEGPTGDAVLEAEAHTLVVQGVRRVADRGGGLLRDLCGEWCGAQNKDGQEMTE
jgi:hypothetical protein